MTGMINNAAGKHDSFFIVEGGNELAGEVEISGSKNAGMPVIVASLLCRGESVLSGICPLLDIVSMGQILEHLGATIAYGAESMRIDTSAVRVCRVPTRLTGLLRASILLLGPLVARYGHVKMGIPGGCKIGDRGIQDHVDALSSLSIKVVQTPEGIEAVAKDGARSGLVRLRMESVTATMNVMMAACYGSGKTQIINAAKEPEIMDLAKCLNKMGFSVQGSGTSRITINGICSDRDAVSPYSHTVGNDRIEAGTFLILGAMAGNPLIIRGCNLGEHTVLIGRLRASGTYVEELEDGSILVQKAFEPKAIDIETYTYPEFPTDLQPLFMAYMATAQGTCVVHEKMFDKRFNQVEGLVRMGANIDLQGSKAIVTGAGQLHGAEVDAPDLRAGAALVLAAAVAKGSSLVHSVGHIDRGYYNLECKLQGLGINIKREQSCLLLCSKPRAQSTHE